jgi:RimJ/RimL family protein N-acetyltransferase
MTTPASLRSGHTEPATLCTARLALRGWRERDLEPFAALNADPRVMEYFPAPLTRVQSDAVARRAQELLVERGYGLWALEVVNGPPFIGFVGLARPSFEAHFTPCVEIGWRLAYEADKHPLAAGHAKARNAL